MIRCEHLAANEFHLRPLVFGGAENAALQSIALALSGSVLAAEDCAIGIRLKVTVV